MIFIATTDYGRPVRIAFTAWPKIHSHPQIFRYGGSIFCLPHWPKFSDFFDLCLHWASVVRDLTYHQGRRNRACRGCRSNIGRNRSNICSIERSSISASPFSSDFQTFLLTLLNSSLMQRFLLGSRGSYRLTPLYS